MRSQINLGSTRAFNIKPFGIGCRFAIKVSSKKQDGSYTKGVFINCKCREMLQNEILYDMEGFFADNEYNDKNYLELIITSAVESETQHKPKAKVEPKVIEFIQLDDIQDDSIPF